LIPTLDFCVGDCRHCTPYQPKPAALLLRCSPVAATLILQLLLLCSSGRMGVAVAGERQGSGGRITAAAAAVLNC